MSPNMQAFLAFLQYFVAALLLLAAFLAVYVRVTPYNEFELIKQDNAAAAISLAGACIGFALPMAAAIYFTHDLLEMIKWAAITGAAQIAVFTLLRRFAPAIEQGHTAPAIFMCAMSVATGVLNAVCIS
jgi:putative membrane protein